MLDALFLIITGLIAGAVDSVAGGGGLITLPALSIVVGAGVVAIGTNKIVGASAAAMALWVYSRRVQLPWSTGFAFAAWIMAGSFGGSRVSPYLPPQAFTWFLVCSYPIILWTIWQKDLWIEDATKNGPKVASRRTTFMSQWLTPRIILAGLACGFYDGMWGPGGGTFMLLALLLVAKLPLLPAIAASKLANTFSASTALMSYGLQGYVRPTTGLWMAAGTLLGAYIGARFASKKAALVVRPLLLAVSTALVAKNIFSF